MDLFKQLKKLEEKIESFFEPGSDENEQEQPPPPPLPPMMPGPARAPALVEGQPAAPARREPSPDSSSTGAPRGAGAPPANAPAALPAVAQRLASPTAQAMQTGARDGGDMASRPVPMRNPVAADAVRAASAPGAQSVAQPAEASPANPQALAAANGHRGGEVQGGATGGHQALRVPPAAPESGAAVSGSFSNTPKLREPLELKKSIVRAIEAEVVRIDGQPTFPFNRVDVDILCVDERHRVRLQAELQDANRLEEDIRRALLASRVSPEQRLQLKLHFIPPDKAKNTQLLRQGYVLECTREMPTQRIRKPDHQRARLVLEQGIAEPMTIVVGKARINMGRMAEVRDQQGRVVRRNDMVFGEEGEINASVSRLHAHVEFDLESDEYRLFDDNSAEGTVVFRDGRRIVVPQGNRRGVSLASGDEIYLGRARLRFER